MQVAFFPPPAATPAPAGAQAGQGDVPAGDAADASFASLLDSNGNQEPSTPAPTVSVGDDVETEPAAAFPPLRKPGANGAADPLSVPEFVTAAIALMDLPVPVAPPTIPVADASAPDLAAKQLEATPADVDGPQPTGVALAGPSPWGAPAPAEALPAAGVAAVSADSPLPAVRSGSAEPMPESVPAGRPSSLGHEISETETAAALQPLTEEPPRPARSVSAAPTLPPTAPALVSSNGPAASPADWHPVTATVSDGAPRADLQLEPVPSPAAENEAASAAGAPLGRDLLEDATAATNHETVVARAASRGLERMLAAGETSIVVTNPRAASAVPMQSTRLSSAAAPELSEVRAVEADANAAQVQDPVSLAAKPAAGAAETASFHQPSAVAAVRTLAQVLAESTPAAQSAKNGKPLPVSPDVSSAAAPDADSTMAAPGKAVAPVAIVDQPTGAVIAAKAAVPDVGTAASRPADVGKSATLDAEAEASSSDSRSALTPSRDRAENVAAGRSPNGRSPLRTEASARGRNFLDVERHGVEKRASSLGTGIAKEAQTMSAQTPVLPPASAALDPLEPVVAGVSVTQTAPGHASKAGGELHVLRSHAAELVRETLEVAERAQATSRNQMELRLPGGDGDLRVHLSWQDGVVHAKFITPDRDLQQALSREWEHAAPKLAEKGLKFGEPSFENRDQSGQSAAQNASNFDQQRNPSRGQSQDGSERAPAFTLRSSASHASASAPRPATTAAATAAPSGQTPSSGTRGLRAWA